MGTVAAGGSRETETRRSRRWGGCLAVFALALAVRLIVLGAVSRTLFFHHPVIDAAHHHAWALKLAAAEADDAGKAFLRMPYFKPPFYPLALSAVYRVFGPGPWPAKVLQAILGALGCVWVFLLARRAFTPLAGWVAGVLAAFYWPWLFFDAWLLNTELVIFLDLSAITLLLSFAARPSAPPWRLAAAGLLLGLSAITWPTGLLVSGVAALWVALGPLRGRDWRKCAAPVCLFVGCVALPVLLVTARNRVVGGDWVLISSNGGVNFYTGTRPEADGVSAVPPGIAWHRLVRETDRAGITKPSAVSHYWVGRGWENLRAAPGRNARLTLKRGAVFFSAAEPRNNLAQAWFLERFGWLRALPDFRLAGPLWAVGLVLWIIALRRRKHGPGFVLAPALCLGVVFARCAGVLPFFVCDRFRVVAVPFMLPLAGYAVAQMWTSLRAWRLRSLALPLGALVVAAVLMAPDFFHARPVNLAPEQFWLGWIHLSRGRTEPAARLLRQSLATEPTADAWLLLCSARLMQKDYRGAVDAARECLSLADDAAGAHGNLAEALLQLGQTAAALASADKAVALEPRRAEYRLTRAETLLRLNRPQDARAELEAAAGVPMGRTQVERYFRLAKDVGTP